MPIIAAFEEFVVSESLTVTPLYHVLDTFESVTADDPSGGFNFDKWVPSVAETISAVESLIVEGLLLKLSQFDSITSLDTSTTYASGDVGEEVLVTESINPNLLLMPQPNEVLTITEAVGVSATSTPLSIQGMIDIISRRVRDPNNTATPRADVLTIIDHVQRAFAVMFDIVVDSASFNTSANQLVYQLSSVLPEAAKMLYLYDGDRQLTFVPYPQLQTIDGGWFRRIGQQHQAWSMVGRDQLIVYPATVTVTSLTATYVKITDTLASEASPVEIAEDELPLLFDFAELLLLAKSRQIGTAMRRLAEFNQKIQVHRRDLVQN